MRSLVSNLFHAASWRPSFAALVVGLICLVQAGCNADPNCRREIGLLRAEIIDLEDRYALLESRYQQKATELAGFTGETIDMTGLSSTENFAEFNGGVIVEGPVIRSSPQYSSPQYTETIIDGRPVLIETTPTEAGIIYDPTGQAAGIAEPQSTSPPLNQRPAVQPGVRSGRSPYLPEPERLPQAMPQPAPSGPPGNLPQPRSGNGEQGQNLRQPNRPMNTQLEGPNRVSQGSVSQAGSRRRRDSVRRSDDITEILINRSSSRGHSVDREVGDEGLHLLIQPKQSNGQVILESGELTVSVLDPKEPESTRRIGLWKFYPEETELFFVNDELASHGILLHLPWDQRTPTRSRLMVHVRFVTGDGRVLQTSSDIRIKPPGDDYSPDDPQVVAWTQQDWRWGLTDRYDPMSADETGTPSPGDDFDINLDLTGQAASDEGAFDADGSRWQQVRQRENRVGPQRADQQGFRRRRATSAPGSTRRNSEARQRTERDDEPIWRPVR